MYILKISEFESFENFHFWIIMKLCFVLHFQQGIWILFIFFALTFENTSFECFAKNLKFLSSIWLSAPLGSSNFDCQSLIIFPLNYTTDRDPYYYTQLPPNYPPWNRHMLLFCARTFGLLVLGNEGTHFIWYKI